MPNPFTRSIKNNFPQADVFICEKTFKAGVDGRGQSTAGQVHLWRSPVPAGLALLQPLPPAVPAAGAGQLPTVQRREAVGWELWGEAGVGECALLVAGPQGNAGCLTSGQGHLLQLGESCQENTGQLPGGNRIILRLPIKPLCAFALARV